MESKSRGLIHVQELYVCVVCSCVSRGGMSLIVVTVELNDGRNPFITSWSVFEGYYPIRLLFCDP